MAAQAHEAMQNRRIFVFSFILDVLWFMDCGHGLPDGFQAFQAYFFVFPGDEYAISPGLKGSVYGSCQLIRWAGKGGHAALRQVPGDVHAQAGVYFGATVQSPDTPFGLFLHIGRAQPPGIQLIKRGHLIGVVPKECIKFL